MAILKEQIQEGNHSTIAVLKLINEEMAKLKKSGHVAVATFKQGLAHELVKMDMFKNVS